MSALLVSIIIPVYNAELYLKRCLDSICSQSYRNVEIICVDDGSTDASLDILKQYAVSDSRVVVIHQENAGPSAARNRGLDVACGDIISFSDADDTLRPDALQYALDVFNAQEYDMLVTGIFHKMPGVEDWYAGVNVGETCTARDLQKRMMWDDRVLGSTCNKYFKFKAIADIRFDEGLTHCEDMHFVSQILQRQPEWKVFISPVATYEYCHNVRSATENPDRLLNPAGKIKYLLAMEKIMALYPRDREMKQVVYATMFRLIWENIRRFMYNPAIVRGQAWQALRYAVAYLMVGKQFPFRQRWKHCRYCIKYLTYRG